MTVDVDQRRGTRILFLAMALSVSLSCLAQTPEPFEVRRAEAAFEELPVLNASEILRPEILAGPHHKANRFPPTSAQTSSRSIPNSACLKRMVTKCWFVGSTRLMPSRS